jgi:lipid-binding SYLF domain-containing protein
VAVIIGSKGLMAGVSLEGSKFTRINKNAAKKSKK